MTSNIKIRESITLCRIYLILFLIIAPDTCSSVEGGLSVWKHIDLQYSKLVQAVYLGNYKVSTNELETSSNRGNNTASFSLGLIYDAYAHTEHCQKIWTSLKNDCRGKTFPFKFNNGLKYSSSKANKWYRKAIKQGHPYAGYMLIKNKFRYSTHASKPFKKKTIDSLKLLHEKGDGVASFMYHDLLGNFSFRPHTSMFYEKRVRNRLHETIDKLLENAREGRILAMHFLGMAYFNLEKYPESFAWYTAAIKHNFSRSAPSRKKVLLFIDDAKKRELISTTKDILLYFDMTLQ